MMKTPAKNKQRHSRHIRILLHFLNDENTSEK